MTECYTNKKTANRSKTYLVPLLTKSVDIEFQYLLINSYIKFNRNVDIDFPIGLLYENEHTAAFDEYCTYLRSTIVYHYDYNIEDTILFIFSFPIEFLDDYKLFKEGKYSRLSKEAKSIIISYSAQTYKYPPIIEELTGVLWKHKTRREKLEKDLNMSLPKDCELASKIMPNEETFFFI